MGIEIRGARDEREVDEAYELASRVFGPDYFTSREVNLRNRRLEPLAALRDAVLALSGGEVVGLVRIVDREAWLGGASLKVGGITAVCIRPDFQGQGSGRAIMEAALERSRQRGDALSIAFARRAVDGFYPRLGYVGLGCHPEMLVTLGRGADASGGAGALKPGFDAQLLDTYAEAYRDSYRDLVLSFRRDAAWWAQLSLRLSRRVDREGFVSVEEGGRPVGYLIAHDGRVIEAASLLGSRRAVRAGILAFAAARGGDLTLALPLGHWAVHALRSMNHTLKVRYAWDGGHVVRVLDRAAFCAALAGLLGAAERQLLLELARLDVDHHDEAHALLMRLVGAWAAPGRVPVLPALPTWTLLDEF